MDKTKVMDYMVELNNVIFIRTRAFIDEQYPELPDKEKIIPIALLTNRMAASVYGSMFQAEAGQAQQKQASDMMMKGLEALGIKK